MPFEQKNLNKRYFSIGEVAKMFELSKSLIRFWEKEFDSLKPHKNGKGERRFTEQNIKQLRIIHNLVKERGFTLDGAKQEIKKNRQSLEEKIVYIDKLKTLRFFLENLKNKL